MNERIKQLAKQAYEDVIKHTPSFLVTKELYEQKFAELMVQDCIRTLRSNGYDDAAKCLQDIHFGIENPV